MDQTNTGPIRSLLRRRHCCSGQMVVLQLLSVCDIMGLKILSIHPCSYPIKPKCQRFLLLFDLRDPGLTPHFEASQILKQQQNKMLSSVFLIKKCEGICVILPLSSTQAVLSTLQTLGVHFAILRAKNVR